jgi:hypothetical protein
MTAGARTSIAWLGLAFAPWPAAAQTILPTTAEDLTFRLQVEKPFLAGEEGIAPLSSILDTDVIFRWSSNIFLQIGVPLAVGQQDFESGTSFYVGSIRGNFLFGEPGVLRAFLGLTLPTATNLAGPDLALLVMALPRLDEEEAWAKDVISARGAWVPSWALSETTRFGFRAGGAIAIPTDFDNWWIYARPAGWLRSRVGGAELRADVLGSYLANGQGSFAELSTAYLDVGAALPDFFGHPGVFVRIPLDADARDAIDFSAGVYAHF